MRYSPSMDLNPLGRFSSRADNYAKYRPSYPVELVDVLRRDCGLAPESIVADIGSGTGLLARLFLDFGCQVFGIEPNARMRQGGEAYLTGYDRFHGDDGQAESTGLGAESVDFVVAGQAFHWFEPAAARAEFCRILREPGWVAIIWNERKVSGDPFLEGYEAMLQKFAPEYGKVDHRRIGAPELAEFFGHSDWKTAVFANDQHLNFDGLRGRVLSSSYSPAEGTAGHEEMMRNLEHLFATTQRDGRVVIAYETRMQYGKLPR